MYTTRFDADNKIWFGPKSEFKINKHENFGETLLEKLNDTDTDRVMQVNIIKVVFALHIFFLSHLTFYAIRLTATQAKH